MTRVFVIAFSVLLPVGIALTVLLNVFDASQAVVLVALALFGIAGGLFIGHILARIDPDPSRRSGEGPTPSH